MCPPHRLPAALRDGQGVDREGPLSPAPRQSECVEWRGAVVRGQVGLCPSLSLHDREALSERGWFSTFFY